MDPIGTLASLPAAGLPHERIHSTTTSTQLVAAPTGRVHTRHGTLWRLSGAGKGYEADQCSSELARHLVPARRQQSATLSEQTRAAPLGSRLEMSHRAASRRRHIDLIGCAAIAAAAACGVGCRRNWTRPYEATGDSLTVQIWGSAAGEPLEWARRMISQQCPREQ